jgi:hypothetical protein
MRNLAPQIKSNDFAARTTVAGTLVGLFLKKAISSTTYFELNQVIVPGNARPGCMWNSVMRDIRRDHIDAHL